MKRRSLLFATLVSLFFVRPAEAQFFNPTDAAVIGRLTEMLRLHREQLVEAIRTARGVDRTFETLRNLDDYERSMRRDIKFISNMDLGRLDDLERLVLYGDQTDFYFRSLTGKIHRDMYNLDQMGRYGDGFLESMDGLGVVDADLIRAIYSNDKTLEELGMTPEEAGAIVQNLGIEASMLDMYQVESTQNLIKALTEQAAQLKRMAADSSLKLDQGQRIMMFNKAEESLLEAMKYQHQLADQLKSRNKEVSRKLLLKGEMEAEIRELEEFYKWHAAIEHNLGFFDSDYVQRQSFR